MSRIENTNTLNSNTITDPLAADGVTAKPALRPEGRNLYMKEDAAPSATPMRQSERRHNAPALMQARLTAEFQATSEDIQRILTRCGGMRRTG